jgi:hypothetical protein
MPERCNKFDKHGRMSSAGGNKGDEGVRDADQSKPQFLIVIQKHHIENGSMSGRNERIVDENDITQNISMKLRSGLWSGPSKVTNDIWIC